MGNSKDMKFGILDSINNKTVSTNGNISTNNDNNISNDVNSNNSRNVSSSKNGNISGNIVITKPILQDKTKRISYYLKEKTISDIEKLAKKSGMGISEFLQNFLDITLDKIEIR